MTNDPSIKDIPSIRKLLGDTANFRRLKGIFPYMRPVLKILRIDVNKLEDVFAQVEEIDRRVQELSVIPDQFNELFAEQGWIIYDSMDIEVAKRAIDTAEAGDIKSAEDILVDYFDVDTVRWQLMRMNGVKVFMPRMPLAEKAFLDYEAERYHACVPVVLSLLDGLVNDLHEQRKGFFAKGVELTAWDSIAAHNKGLGYLTQILQKSRGKTRTEPITVPYRHGIMHGRDLGYDNKIVAAKCWAALFATREWAIKAEQDLISAPPEKPEPTWKEVFSQLIENEREKQRLQEWQPRQIEVGKDIPGTGTPEDFGEGTPEQKLAGYLDYWKQRNYGYMAQYLHPRFGPDPQRRPARVREEFGSKELLKFGFIDIQDEAAATTNINTSITFRENGKKVEKQIRFRMVNVDKEGDAGVRGKVDTYWVIINWNDV